MKPLLNDTNKKTFLGQETQAMDIRLVEIWSFGLESKFDIFGSNLRVFWKCGVGERMISVCVFPTVKHGGGGVMGCGGALLVTLSVIDLEFMAHLTSMATTAFCNDTPSHLVWA
jgi:hypothetical protein